MELSQDVLAHIGNLADCHTRARLCVASKEFWYHARQLDSYNEGFENAFENLLKKFDSSFVEIATIKEPEYERDHWSHELNPRDLDTQSAVDSLYKLFRFMMDNPYNFYLYSKKHTWVTRSANSWMYFKTTTGHNFEFSELNGYYDDPFDPPHDWYLSQALRYQRKDVRTLKANNTQLQAKVDALQAENHKLHTALDVLLSHCQHKNN